MNIQQAMKNPNVVFASPELVEASMEFTIVQKCAILTQWQDQVERLLVADDEGMISSNARLDANAECLRQVTDILTRLARA